MVPLHRSKAVSRSGPDPVMAPGLAITMNLVTGLELAPALAIAMNPGPGLERAPGLAIAMNLVPGLELAPGLVIARTFDQIHAALQSLNIIALLSRSRAAHYYVRPQ